MNNCRRAVYLAGLIRRRMLTSIVEASAQKAQRLIERPRRLVRRRMTTSVAIYACRWLCIHVRLDMWLQLTNADLRGDDVADVAAPTRQGAKDEEMDHHNQPHARRPSCESFMTTRTRTTTTVTRR